MSLFKRISNVIRSNVNDVLDKAEDPRKILDQTIMDMQKDHKSAKKKLIETMTLEKQAERQLANYKTTANDWEQKAMAALKAGDEGLARQALAEKQKTDEMIVEAETGAAQQTKFTAELKQNLKLLEQKIEEAKKKRDELVSRMKAADAKKRQAEMTSGDDNKNPVGNSSAFDTFDRMVEKIERSEAEVEAHSELVGVTSDDVDAKLNEHFKAKTEDDLLAQLKAKMSDSDDAPAPVAPSTDPAADDKSDAIEDELAALRAKLDP